MSELGKAQYNQVKKSLFCLEFHLVPGGLILEARRAVCSEAACTIPLRAVGGRTQRRHPGSEAIDWPTGVSKHCCSRSPITQHTLCSNKMCPSGTYHRIQDSFTPSTHDLSCPLLFPRPFFMLRVGNFDRVSAGEYHLSWGPRRERGCAPSCDALWW